MPKLKLVADPTFKASVDIPVAGGGKAPVEFVFIHRTRDAFNKWRVDMQPKEDAEGKSDLEVTMDIISGWDLDDPFGPESVEKLLQNYHGAAAAISTAYAQELLGARRGN